MCILPHSCYTESCLGCLFSSYFYSNTQIFAVDNVHLSHGNHYTWAMWAPCKSGACVTALHRCQYWHAGCKDDKISQPTQRHSARPTVWLFCIWAVRRYGCTSTRDQHLKWTKTSENTVVWYKKKDLKHQSCSSIRLFFFWMPMSNKCQLWKHQNIIWIIQTCEII